MAKIFDLNNPVWQFIGKLVDATVLHFCWLLCSLPIVTIGASTTALYYAMMKDVADEETHYVKAFFRSFKQNLKQGIIMGLIFMVVGALLAYATYFYMQQNGTTGWSIMRGISILAALLYLFTLQFAFPLLARFDNTVGNLIKNAFFMSVKHIGWSIVMVFILAAMLFVAFGLQFIPILIPGFGLVVYLDAYILNHVLKPYIKAAGGGDDEDKDPDAWTVPEEEELTGEVTGEVTEEAAGEAAEAAREMIGEVTETVENTEEVAEEVTEVKEDNE